MVRAPHPDAILVVAMSILRRWRAAGCEAWARKGGPNGPPQPLGAHVNELVRGRTTPSGKALFRCVVCELETPCPTAGRCRGEVIEKAIYPLVDALTAGVRYELDSAGLPRPKTEVPHG